ncbi:endopeptidase La OS=Streptomyces alboniger OX=132473 GN=CP975_23675 PE=3 SV=1 [Streptomyces alboniger]
MLASTLMLIALLCAESSSTCRSEMSPGTVNTLGDHDGEPVLQISVQTRQAGI